MEFLIITGMSGSGKSQASNILEDLGYYCIDNMPSAMIGYFANLYTKMPGKTSNVALVIDVRGETDFHPLVNEIKRLCDEGFTCRIIFMDSEDRVIINRYKESRRSHPLVAHKNISVSEALAEERVMLAPVKDAADYVIDTTNLTASQLRNKLISCVGGTLTGSVVITCMSFGFKYGVPTDADLVFDVRCFPNPYYIAELRDKTGLDKPVKDYVFASKNADEFKNKLIEMLDFLIPLYVEEGKNQLTIAIGCTGGKHRSVAFTEAVSEHLSNSYSNVMTIHRDIIKKFIGDK